ncbi:MAG: ATP cone domain-containing protein [Bacteroidetes bacterium]|nr:ATP cone domain-containing protein [Bacteroidota bacterium]MDA0874130.1 ATP cone domain-containing protein [Bacteroidota bacterium]
MASNKSGRLLITSASEGASVPFLRGILTRSLQKAGLPFEEAYEVASVVRDRLAKKGEISGNELRALVVRVLEKRGHNDVAEAYLRSRFETPTIRVTTSDGSDAPFSKGQLTDSLEICALPREQLHDIASGIETALIEEGKTEISSKELTQRVLAALGALKHPHAAADYERWVRFSLSGKPMVILIGGTTGSGKSSVGAEIAHRLDIVRTQSTDMLREIMRLLVPERLIPTLHTSSFEAYTKLPMGGETATSEDMIQGYLTQSSQVGVGIEGVLNRTANESVSLIMEGVHLHPRLMAYIAQKSDFVVVPVLLAVIKEKRLKKRLVGRGQLIQSRRSERYIQHFEHIWDLQSFLLDEAEDYDIPIITNHDEETTIRAILQTVSNVLRDRYQKEDAPKASPATKK